jgi:hypothetical protein
MRGETTVLSSVPKTPNSERTPCPESSAQQDLPSSIPGGISCLRTGYLIDVAP